MHVLIYYKGNKHFSLELKNTNKAVLQPLNQKAAYTYADGNELKV